VRARSLVNLTLFFPPVNICIEDKRSSTTTYRGDRTRLVAVQQKLALAQAAARQRLPADECDWHGYLSLIAARRTTAATTAASVAATTAAGSTAAPPPPPSVDDVPAQFFEASFSLCERNTFDYCNGVQIPTLARWLDQVESRLLFLLAERASELFVALARVDELRQLTTHSAAQARTLDSLLRAMRSRELTLRVLRLQLRRERAQRVERQLSLLGELRHAVPMLELLVAGDDYAAALDLVETAMRVIDSELGGVQALHATRARLLQAASDIDARMRRQFLDALCFGADAPAEQVPLVLVLARTGRLAPALHAYVDAAQVRLQRQVEQLGEWARVASLDDAAFGAVLRDALALLRAAAVERAGAVHAAIDGAARSHANDAALVAVRECAATIVARALTARSERLRHASVADYARVHDVCSQLCAQLGAAAARTLLATLQTLARAFVDAFHASRRASLQLLLESELWAPTAVPAQSWTSADASRLYVGDDRAFLCTNAVLVLLGMLDAYVECGAALPMLAGEVVARATQLLKQFNEQTCALVLGAGAVRLLRLKTVSARHLALALQSVELLLTLLPDMRRRLLAPLDAPRATLAAAPLAALERDLGAHVAQIDAKFAALLQDRVAVYLSGQVPLDVLVDDTSALLKVLTRCLDDVARRRALAAIGAAVRPLLAARPDDPFNEILESLRV